MLTPAATFRVALIQMRSARSPAANLDAAAKLIGEAKAGGADYVQTPEMTNILEARRDALLAAIRPEHEDPSLAAFRELARHHRLWLHLGSLALKISPDRAVNRGFLIDPGGEIATRYDKIHMFDVDLANGESYRESRSYAPGEHAVTASLPWGRLGLTICYDLRFPGLYRALAEAGSVFLAIPSSFTKQTGEAHWHVLNRARAIENGRVLAEGDVAPAVVIAEIDPGAVTTARARIPSLQHGRRFELIEPMPPHPHLHVV
jgi:deaminated glutathione amidase